MINQSLIPMLKNPVDLISLGFGSGLATRAPGTWGTLAAMPFAWVLSLLPLPVQLVFIAAAFGFGVWCCDQTRLRMGTEDPSAVVWDEFVGLWIALLYVPWERAWPVLGFLLFRVFDVLKPWPASWADQHVKGGLGIMLDDVIAGLFALIAIQMIIRVS